MTTFEILEALQNEVGSRRAGTEGEERAQNWLKEKAEKLGLFVEMDEFTFIGNEKYRPMMMLLSFSVIAAAIWLFSAGKSCLQQLPLQATFYSSTCAKK